MATATPASSYAAQAPLMAADRLRMAADPTNYAGLGNAAINPSSPVTADMTAPLASLMTLQHQLGVAPAGSTTLNIHPTNGVTVKTSPAVGGTKPVHPASKPAGKAGASPTSNVGSQIASGDLIDAYNQEAKGIPGQVASIYSPIATSLANLFNARSQTMQNAINSYTPIYGQLLGGYQGQSAANYGEAEKAQGAVDAMLQAALGGQGAASSAQLANEIGSTGVAPDVAARMEGVNSARYQGAEGAAAARGAASLSQLIGQGANAENYGAQLPGVAGAAGLLATRQGQAQISNDEMSALNQLAQNEGQTSGQLYGDLRQALNNMGMLELYYGPRGQASVTTAGANVTKANAAQTNAAANTTRAGAYAGGYMTAAQANAAANQKRAGAAVTNAAANTTRAGAYAKKVANGPAPSTAQVTKFWQTAYQGEAPKFYQGKPVAGTGQPPMHYQDAINYAVKVLGQSPTQATRAANALYKPGEGGRPLFTKGQQASNAVLFPNPLAPFTGGK